MKQVQWARQTQTTVENPMTAERRRTYNAGFTLVELIVVLVIMGILTAAILPMVTGYVATAREKVGESNLHMVEQAARLYLTRWEMEAGGTEGLSLTASELVQKGYLSPLPEGEDYQITITHTDDQYDIQVTPNKADA